MSFENQKSVAVSEVNNTQKNERVFEVEKGLNIIKERDWHKLTGDIQKYSLNKNVDQSLYQKFNQEIQRDLNNGLLTQEDLKNPEKLKPYAEKVIQAQIDQIEQKEKEIL